MALRKLPLRYSNNERYEPCSHPEHNPPSHEKLSPGIYENTCPRCGTTIQFSVGEGSWANVVMKDVPASSTDLTVFKTMLDRIGIKYELTKDSVRLVDSYYGPLEPFTGWCLTLSSDGDADSAINGYPDFHVDFWFESSTEKIVSIGIWE